MTTPAPAVRWLHVSDLHVGRPGATPWWQDDEAVARSLAATIALAGGPPDVLVVSGDLAWSGRPAEYELVEELLEALQRWLADAGAGPVPVVAVPGNHDVTRPALRQARTYKFLDTYDVEDDDGRELRDQLWSERDASPVADLFTAWTTFARDVIPRWDPPGAARHPSIFPGDGALIVPTASGPRLGIVGLNTAWAAYRDGVPAGRLHLDEAQLREAVPDRDVAAFQRETDLRLLVHHHPIDALSPRSQAQLRRTIARPGRFALLLHGHVLGAETVSEARSGGRARLSCAAPSLFGAPTHGAASTPRTFGYILGEAATDDSLHVWARARVTRADDEVDLDVDTSFGRRGARGAVHLRGPTVGPARSPVVASEPPRPPRITRQDVQRYRDAVAERYRTLRYIGVRHGDLGLPMDDVVIRLRFEARDAARRLRLGDPAYFEDACEQHADAEDLHGLDLDEALELAVARGADLVLFGEPGAGKSTCLEWLARRVAVGGTATPLDPATTPVLLPARALVDAPPDEPFEQLLQRTLDEHYPDAALAGLAAHLWRGRGLLLLVDGLDEVANLRDRIAASRRIAREAGLLRQRGGRTIVSCRFAGYRHPDVTLGPAFLALDVAPLDNDQMERLVRQWFDAAHRHLPAQRLSAAALEREVDAAAARVLGPLLAADEAAQRLRSLASSPLMLTLLCVVGFREPHLPRRRASLYQRALVVLLARGHLRHHDVPFDEVDATELLAGLAWHLHRAQRRDDLSGAELSREASPKLDAIRAAGRRAPDAERLQRWLVEESGLFVQFREDHYGFRHLGFQEYLAALHAVRTVTSASGRPEAHPAIATFAAAFGEDWWREAALLFVGLPDHDLFGPLFRAVLARGDQALEDAHRKHLTECLLEAHRPDARPFVEVLEDPDRSDAAKAAIVGLFLQRPDPAIAAAARKLNLAPESALEAASRELQRRLGADAPDERPAVSTGYDVFVSYHSQDRVQVEELVIDLQRRGFRVFYDVWECPAGAPFSETLEAAIESARAAAVVLGPSGKGRWQELELRAALDVASREGRPVIPVLLPGGPPPTALPLFLRQRTAVDLAGDRAEGLRRLDAGIRGRAPGPPPDLHVESAFEVELLSESPGEPGEIVEPITGLRFLRVDGGEYTIGAAELPGVTDDDVRERSRPVHRVETPTYHLAVTPVTHAQWARFLAAHPEREEPAYWRDRRFEGADQPVVGVTWHDAMAFCAWLSEASGLPVELPTEARWEVAARGRDARPYPWGRRPPEDDLAVFDRDWNTGGPEAVGSRPLGAGPFGHLDLAGNVWEWCRDRWDPRAYHGRDTAEVTVDPGAVVAEPGAAGERAVRGGAWLDPARRLRSAFRSGDPASARHVDLGVRVALSPGARPLSGRP